jgi:hypothetical protein
MRVLPFVRREEPASIRPPTTETRRFKTRCEACGEPTVRHACPPAAGAVQLICLTCEHRWVMPERRATPRPVDAPPIAP